jgi:hypothetical protein
MLNAWLRFPGWHTNWPYGQAVGLGSLEQGYVFQPTKHAQGFEQVAQHFVIRFYLVRIKPSSNQPGHLIDRCIHHMRHVGQVIRHGTRTSISILQIKRDMVYALPFQQIGLTPRRRNHLTASCLEFKACGCTHQATSTHYQYSSIHDS